MFGWSVAIVCVLLALSLTVRLAESRAFCEFGGELRRMWRAAGVPGRALAAVVVILCAQSGGSKGVAPVTSLFRLLFWQPGTPWQIAEPAERAEQSKEFVAVASNAFAVVDAATNAVVTISFDWHARGRLPYHDAQNVLAQTVRVCPTNIAGTLYEDHYVAFNAVASTNPAVILIEYARRRDDGTVERETSRVTTNSYPITSVVSLQSGSYTCYWFRCAVPPAYTNAVRDWNGEALFGAPVGSGKGFDLLGTLVVDDGNSVWVGANTNFVAAGVTNCVRNGIITEE